jgi:hypothetical protein
MTNNYFTKLNAIDVSKKVEEKNDLTYLSWAWAWAELMKIYPQATYKIHRYDNLPYMYDDNTGYMVSTEMTIDGDTKEMWLPVMDSSNKAMKSKEYTYDTKYKKGLIVKQATMFDVNKTIMRCLVKNIAMFGLGLYIYAGEDLPELPLFEKIKKAMNGAKTEKSFDDIWIAGKKRKHDVSETEWKELEALSLKLKTKFVKGDKA